MTFGHYMIACFDVLGQSSKLLEMSRRPPGSKEEAIESLRQTAGVVLSIRDRFEQWFRAETELSATLPKPRLIRWGVSDTYIVAVPITLGGDKVLATVWGIYRTMCAASMMWLVSLSEGHPLRGGIEIGLAADIEPAEVYGPALVEAHRLESCIAKYPRIVVGKECIDFLRTIARDPRRLMGDHDHRLAATNALACLRMLREEIKGEHAMLDSLGDDYLSIVKDVEPMRDIFQRAHEQVVAELRLAEINKDRKLTLRYERLLSYFGENASKWGARMTHLDVGVGARASRRRVISATFRATFDKPPRPEN